MSGRYYVDRTLKGAKPVEQPTKFDRVVNLKTAKALGIKFPAVVADPGRPGDRMTAVGQLRPAGIELASH